jgi:hypothetical protein
MHSNEDYERITAKNVIDGKRCSSGRCKGMYVSRKGKRVEKMYIRYGMKVRVIHNNDIDR